MEKYTSPTIRRVLSPRRIIFLGLLALVTISFYQYPIDSRQIDDVWKAHMNSRAYKRPGYEKPVAHGIPLRVMGLGASTILGQGGPGGGGWRPAFRQILSSMGNPINMVGSQRFGDLVDNDIEAYPGARVDKVYHHAQKVVRKMQPNLVILYVGSNDNFQNTDLPNLYKRYYALVNSVLTSSPKSTIVMGTLMVTTETEQWGGQDRYGGINEQLRRLYEIFKREGKPVVLVDMDDEWGIHVENLGPDHMHPSIAGYQIMARKFLEGILEADARGFLQAPEPVPGIVDDGELERLDMNSTSVLSQMQLEREEKEKAKEIEEEAIEQMIFQLQRAPWDGRPPVDRPVLPIPERPQNKIR